MITYQYLQFFIYTCFKQIETTANIKYFSIYPPSVLSSLLREGHLDMFTSFGGSPLGGVFALVLIRGWSGVVWGSLAVSLCEEREIFRVVLVAPATFILLPS